MIYELNTFAPKFTDNILSKRYAPNSTSVPN